MAESNNSRRVYHLAALRRPVYTLFLTLLIAVISFAVIMRAVEYITVRTEAERIEGYYRAIGYVTTGLDDLLEGSPLLTEVTDWIALNPYTADEDRRRLTAGIMDGIYNVNLRGVLSDSILFTDFPGFSIDYFAAPEPYNFGIHIDDAFIYGEFTRIIYDDDQDIGRLVFRVDTVEAAYPEIAEPGKLLYLLLIPEITGAGMVENILSGIEPGERYFLKVYLDASYTWDSLLIKPLDGETLFYLAIPHGESVDLNNNMALNHLIEELNILRKNQQTIPVSSTIDMSLIPAFQYMSQYRLRSGRLLTKEDHETANPVCVIPTELASIRGIELGDTLKLTLRDKIDFFISGYIADDEKELWQNYPTGEIELEVVGIYRDNLVVEPPFNPIYIPDSCLPLTFKSWSPDYRAYSFILNSIRNIPAFEQELFDAFGDSEVDVKFVNLRAAESFIASVDVFIQSVTFNVILFGILLFPALALTVFLYLNGSKREYAILRALGEPTKQVRCGLNSVIIGIGAVAVPLGGISAWFFGLDKVNTTISGLADTLGSDVETVFSLSWVWLIGLCGGVFVLLTVFTLLGTVFMARRPVRELLQGGRGK